MKLGLQINRFNWPGSPDNIGRHLIDVARAAEESGFDSIWVMDHFFQIGYLGPSEDPMLEAYTVLGYLAAATKKVKLGTLVTGVIYREPALLIKAVTSLDIISRGRAYLGIGAGWNEEEAEGLGFPNTPLTANRFERLEETLQIAKKMFGDDQSPFEGSYYHLKRPINHPTPLSKPHPPILIGGGGEQRTLKLVAQYGDACNVFARGSAEDAQHKFSVLKNHCDKLGRDFSAIEKTVLSVEVGAATENPGTAVRLAKDLSDVGTDHIIYGIGDGEISAIKKFAPLAAKLSKF
ncbi:MAG: LLM class F420-dependent oxidoreductase [Candidatus Saccharimonadia bacterium]